MIHYTLYIRRQVAKKYVDILRKQDEAGVVSFYRYADLLQPLTTDHTAVKRAIDQVPNTNSGTSLSAGVSKALDVFSLPNMKKTGVENHEKAMKVIILLTDGEGDYDEAYTQKAIEKGIKIYTAGLGVLYGRAILEKIAKDTGARFYHANVAEAL